MSTKPGNFVFAFLRNGSASKNMAVDGTTPVNFDYTAPASGAHISRLNMHMADAGMSPYGEFGGLGSILTNGCTIKVFASNGTTVLIDFFDGETWKRNSDIVALAGIDLSPDPDAGIDSNPIRWTISKAGDTLKLGPNEIIRMTISDDLSDMDEFFCMVQGVVA